MPKCEYISDIGCIEMTVHTKSLPLSLSLTHSVQGDNARDTLTNTYIGTDLLNSRTSNV